MRCLPALVTCSKDDISAQSHDVKMMVRADLSVLYYNFMTHTVCRVAF